MDRIILYLCCLLAFFMLCSFMEAKQDEHTFSKIDKFLMNIAGIACTVFLCFQLNDYLESFKLNLNNDFVKIILMSIVLSTTTQSIKKIANFYSKRKIRSGLK